MSSSLRRLARGRGKVHSLRRVSTPDEQARGLARKAVRQHNAR